MSAEVYQRNPDNAQLVDAVSGAVGEILKATGVAPAVAHTTGELGARYATELLLSAMEFTGEIGRGQLSDYSEYIKKFAAVTLDPSREDELFPDDLEAVRSLDG